MYFGALQVYVAGEFGKKSARVYFGQTNVAQSRISFIYTVIVLGINNICSGDNMSFWLATV